MRELWDNEIIRAGVVLVLGLLAIIFFNPPRTTCQAQTEILQDGTKKFSKEYKGKYDKCFADGTQGSCVGIFEVISKLIVKLGEVTSNCLPEIGSDSATRGWINKSLSLYVKVAWGTVPPQSYVYRNGPLELSQIIDYCRLRRKYIEIYGDEAWVGFINSTLNDLPGAAPLGRVEAWQRSLVSDTCQYNF